MGTNEENIIENFRLFYFRWSRTFKPAPTKKYWLRPASAPQHWTDVRQDYVRHEAGDLRQETRDRRQETSVVDPNTLNLRNGTGKRENGDRRLEKRDRRREKEDRRLEKGDRRSEKRGQEA